jgi:hypothetical protein
MAAEILCYVSPGGQVRIKVKGVKGPDCLKLTEEFEKSLGKVISRELTREFCQKKRLYRKKPQPDGSYKTIYLD